MSSSKAVDKYPNNIANHMKNTESFLKKEGIISQEEKYETVFLAEDEIEKFMAKYLSENPGVEIETRYIKQPPVQVVQDIQVRWLRPPTPEMPPIIIREVSAEQKERPPLRVIEKPKVINDTVSEPIVIREKPPAIPIGEPKVAYIQNVVKKPINTPANPENKCQDIKVEIVRSDTNNNNCSSRSLEENCKKESRCCIEEDELKCYEERLKQTLFQEYLIKQEREKLERKLSEQRCKEERAKNYCCSSDSSQAVNQEKHYKEEQERKQKQNEAIIKIHHESSKQIKHKQQPATVNGRLNFTGYVPDHKPLSTIPTIKSDTSTYKNIKFTKVTDQNELNRFNEIYSNPNTPFIKNKLEGDKILSSFEVTEITSVSSNRIVNGSPKLSIHSNSKTFNENGTNIPIQNETSNSKSNVISKEHQPNSNLPNFARDYINQPNKDSPSAFKATRLMEDLFLIHQSLVSPDQNKNISMDISQISNSLGSDLKRKITNMKSFYSASTGIVSVPDKNFYLSETH